MAGSANIPNAIAVAASADDAVKHADIICAATTSSVPVFNGERIKPGTHINGVGSFTPSMQEFDLKTIQQSLVVVDSVDAVLEEAGEIIIPLNNGDIDRAHIHAELGEIVLGTKTGRTSDAQITFFKSVGVAAQDAISASIAVANATAQDLGIVLPA
jgi:ornithine cyclodeaminase/alanine dehydrogenase-like protein (mu-crystallin family)